MFVVSKRRMHRVWCGAWLERMRRTSHYMVGFLSSLRASSCSLPLFPGDGVDFLSWFLNALHSALGGTKKKKKSKLCCLSKESPIFFVFAFFLEKKIYTYTASSILRQSLAGAPAGLELRFFLSQFPLYQNDLERMILLLHPQKWGLQICAIRLC